MVLLGLECRVRVCGAGCSVFLRRARRLPPATPCTHFCCSPVTLVAAGRFARRMLLITKSRLGVCGAGGRVWLRNARRLCQRDGCGTCFGFATHADGLLGWFCYVWNGMRACAAVAGASTCAARGASAYVRGTAPAAPSSCTRAGFSFAGMVLMGMTWRARARRGAWRVWLRCAHRPPWLRLAEAPCCLLHHAR